MIQGYNESIVSLPSNSAPVTLTTDCIRTRSTYNWLCHSQGSPIYKIKQGGRYRVSFNTNVTSAATVTQVPTIQNTNLIITREC